MPIELIILAWGCLLALVHIFAAVRAKTAQYGTAWNVGARDQSLPEPKPLVGRLARAQANYFETFPIVAIAILIDAQLDLFDRWTAIGAALWLGARIVYLPLYAAGVPVVRTMVFGISMIGVLMLLWPALRLAF
ncbi:MULTISPECIES: MAPEG family protein [unclassified Sphingobium]|uniref:MAPEG family protein n=1 Tax=unclassified Sphingobium TaxID=2611147 RepID=UPI0022243074|nr:MULTISPECIES: MAPEG family protein [unclassified Sphingobium]MCW2348829.1 putative MAPEG superfamily protein [Sphingobium sp. B12D2B]MCW2367957.1 putative MAPEG superfamily protein [Sphingobium sp. B11D3D]